MLFGADVFMFLSVTDCAYTLVFACFVYWLRGTQVRAPACLPVTTSHQLNIMRPHPARQRLGRHLGAPSLSPVGIGRSEGMGGKKQSVNVFNGKKEGKRTQSEGKEERRSAF